MKPSWRGQTWSVHGFGDRWDTRIRGLAVVICLLWVSSVGVLYAWEDSDAANAGRSPAVEVPPEVPAEEAEPAASPPRPMCDIGPADGQEAITAAIQACPDGSTVRFPAGRTYLQTHAITVVGRRSLVIDGNGSTFVSSAPNVTTASIYDARPNWQIVEGRDVTLRNVTIRGNLPAGPRGILPGNQYNAGIMVYGGDGVHVSDVSVFSVFGEFLVSSPSGFFHGKGALDGEVPKNVQVDRLNGDGAARQCVAVTAAHGFHLRDSTLRNCYQNGVDVEHDVAGEPARDVHILRNSISGYRFAAITVPTAYAPGDVDGVEIRGNTTSPSDTCFPSVLVGGVQVNRNPLYNIVVVDNRLETLYEGVKATHVASGTVAGNQITLKAPPSLCGPPAPLPVRLIESPGLAVEANRPVGYGA